MRMEFFGKGYNQLYLTTAFDILNLRYIDAVIKDFMVYSEPKALMEMVDRYDGKQAIFIVYDVLEKWLMEERNINEELKEKDRMRLGKRRIMLNSW